MWIILFQNQIDYINLSCSPSNDNGAHYTDSPYEHIQPYKRHTVKNLESHMKELWRNYDCSVKPTSLSGNNHYLCSVMHLFQRKNPWTFVVLLRREVDRHESLYLEQGKPMSGVLSKSGSRAESLASYQCCKHRPIWVDILCHASSTVPCASACAATTVAL